MALRGEGKQSDICRGLEEGREVEVSIFFLPFSMTFMALFTCYITHVIVCGIQFIYFILSTIIGIYAFFFW